MLDLIKVEEVDNKVIIPKEDFEKIIADVDSLIETVEILSDEELIEQIKEIERNIKEGKVKEIKSKKILMRSFFDLYVSCNLHTSF